MPGLFYLGSAIAFLAAIILTIAHEYRTAAAVGVVSYLFLISGNDFGNMKFDLKKMEIKIEELEAEIVSLQKNMDDVSLNQIDSIKDDMEVMEKDITRLFSISSS